MKNVHLIALMMLACGIALVSAGARDTVSGTVTLREADSPFIAFNIWVKAGSQNDPAGKEGLSALTAALLANGSTTQDRYEVILEKLYPMAAGYGSGVDKEMTVFRGRIHRDNLEAYYTLFKNALLSPAFAEEDFNRIKAQTVNTLEQSRRYARDEELSKELLYWMAYQGTPYAHPEEGYVQSVKSITLDDVKQFYADHYVRNNIVIGIGGGYPEGFVERVRADFNTLPEKAVKAVPAPQPKMPAGMHILIVEKQTAASAISLGFPTKLLRTDDDFFAMMLANSWMGEHRNSNSNLYQVIREIRGMNYGDYSYIEAFPAGFATQQPPINIARRSHLFEIWIRPISMTAPGTLHDRTLFATRAALRELKKFAESGMTAETFDKTLKFLWNFTVNYGDTITRRLAYAIDDAFYGYPAPGFLAAIRPGLKALTLEQVNAAIRKHLQAENIWVVIITADAEAMKAKILSGEPTNITYAGEKPQSLLDEDKIIASFPLPAKAENITIMKIGEVFEK